MVGTSNQSVPKMAIDRVNKLKPVSGLHPLLGLEEAYTTPAGLHWGISFWGVDSPEIRLIYIYRYRYNSFTTEFCLPQELSFKWRPKATPTQYILGVQVSTDFRDRMV